MPTAEQETYDKVKDSLPKGKFALIHDGKIVGTYDTQDEALSVGALEFGLEPYMIRQVGQEEITLKAPALTLGILRADRP